MEFHNGKFRGSLSQASGEVLNQKPVLCDSKLPAHRLTRHTHTTRASPTTRSTVYFRHAQFKTRASQHVPQRVFPPREL